MKRRLGCEQGLLMRVEAISERGEVTASFWATSTDPVLEQVMALEKIC